MSYIPSKIYIDKSFISEYEINPGTASIPQSDRINLDDYINQQIIAGIILSGAGGTVLSVNTRTGAVVLTSADVGLGNVNNTSDANKPLSTATLAALALKQDLLVSGTNIKTVNGQSLLGSGDVTIVSGGAVSSVFTRTGAVVAAAGDYTATQITNTPAGNIAAVNLQSAINELDTEKVTGNTAITGATKTKITYDSKGLVTAGADATTADVLTSTALTIAGTAFPIGSTTQSILGAIVADNTIMHLAGAETVTGVKTFTAQPVGITAASIVNVPAGNIAATNLQGVVAELDTEKNTNIQFQDETVALGTAGTVDTINFTGVGVTATRVGNTLTATINGAPAATGSTSVAAGTIGTVPLPAAGTQNQFLKGNMTYGSSIPAWTTSTAYNVGDVIYDPATNLIYRTSTAHTAGATITLTNFTLLASPLAIVAIEGSFTVLTDVSTTTSYTIPTSTTIPTGTDPSRIDLYHNGIRLSRGTRWAYTSNTTSSVTLNVLATAAFPNITGDLLEIVIK